MEGKLSLNGLSHAFKSFLQDSAAEDLTVLYFSFLNINIELIIPEPSGCHKVKQRFREEKNYLFSLLDSVLYY